MSIALVDYGAGNLTSVRKALAAVGADVYTPDGPADLARARGVIVPGVGHFGSTRTLDQAWRHAILERLDHNRPLLGICVGLQWLFAGSTEAPDVPGFGVCQGLCDRLPDVEPATGARQKVPHVGWNTLALPRWSRLFAGIADGSHVYFTHSYAAPLARGTVATSSYGIEFTAAVEEGLVSGVQFHPETSGQVGLQVLRNWLTGVT
ncbi:MAG: imidazole glycerol phosphate synthase subunit HisH [Acidobacteria bacterium]|nr:imidazole glycerol phosphate synthase subunit HisH [Acidobacteriota bacterium]